MSSPKGYDKLPPWAKQALDNGGAADIGAQLARQGDVGSDTLSVGQGFRQLNSGLVVVEKGLDIRQGASLKFDGMEFPVGTVLGAGVNGAAQPIFTDTGGVALIRGGASDSRGVAMAHTNQKYMLTQTFNPLGAPSALGAYVNQQLRASLVYVPTRSWCYGFSWDTATAPSVYNGSNVNGFAIYQPSVDALGVGTGVITYTRLAQVVALGAVMTVVGYNSRPWATPILLEPGPYYMCQLNSWSSITGTYTPTSNNYPSAGFVVEGQWGNFPLGWRLNTQVAFPATVLSTNANYGTAQTVQWNALIGQNTS